jgi:release factor glutamine methyltransferase
VLAIDREAHALALAGENVAAHGLQERVELKEGDLLAGISADVFDVIVSNPPYVAEAEMPGLPGNVRDHEPASALVSGAEGLDAIRRLIPQAHRCLRPGGSLLMEIGETQAGAVVELMVRAGFAEVEVHRDLAGRERIVTGRL